jgi:putative copper export protein
MTDSLRNLMLTAHVTASVGWIGALAVFLAHALAGLLSQDDQTVRALSLAMGLTAWFVILPLSLASLATGVVQAMGTAWGLMRHYWIVFKLLLTAAATVVLLLKLGPISYLAEMAANTAFSSADLIGLRASTTFHAAGGLLVLLLAAVLAIYKPQGMTPYGVRKRNEQSAAGIEPRRGRPMSTPLWVKACIAVIVILVLMIAFMLLGGEHGPAAHGPSRS